MPRGLVLHSSWFVAAVFAVPAAVYICGMFRPAAAGAIGAGLAGLAFAGALAGLHGGMTDAQVMWLPTWGASLRFAYDGLAALFTLLTTGIGCVVLVYAQAYMRHDLENPRARARFHALMTLFMAAMVGLVTSQDLYSLLICWDLTAIASYALIATHVRDRAARSAANSALIVTAGSAVLLFAAFVLLHAATGVTDLTEVTARAEPGPALTAAGLMIACAALAKSAQAPLHFWLPRAMVAPTPVSAYLHSAAMVAAGVFLLGRLHPLLAASGPVLDVLTWIGAASIVTGSLLALTRDDIKSILAYSTIAQYGYIVWLLGDSSEAAAGAAAFYVVAHALAKCGLFLTAGAVSSASHGERRLSRLGQLGRRMPALAAASAVCAAGLSALPLTIGFFKDELFFEAARHRGSIGMAVAVAAAALTFAYTWRLWFGLFWWPAPAETPAGGEGHARRPATQAPSAWLTGPVVLLAAAIVAGGVWPRAFTGVAEAAGGVIHSASVDLTTAYHAEPRATYAMAAWAYLLGLVVFLFSTTRAHHASSARLERLGERLGPDRVYHGMQRTLAAFSTWLHRIEVRDLRDRAAAILAPGGLLIGAALIALPGSARLRVGEINASDVPLIAALSVSVLAAVAAARPRRHVAMVLALSMVSYSLAMVFVLLGAPDVAIVALLVQTVSTMLLIGALSLFPRGVLRETAEAESITPRRARVVTVIATAGAFIFAWVTLSWSAPPALSHTYVNLAPDAHARDVVIAIVADFRGLDTLGEAMVLATSLLGVTTLLRWRGRSP